MSSELQHIVDGLGRRLLRAVAIDDTRLRLQAYSPHYGAVDEVRLRSILHREASAEVSRYVMAHGIADAQGPVRVSANSAEGFLSRLCIPVRHLGLLVGYLWLIETEVDLTADEVALAQAAADAAGVVMYRERLVAELERGRERELLRDLLAPEAEMQRRAAAEIIDNELLVPSPGVLVLVAEPDRAAAPSNAATRDAIDLALTETRQWLSHRRLIHLGRFDHGVLVAALCDELRTDDQQRQLAGRARRALLKHLAALDPDAEVFVGIGAIQSSLDAALASYRQARQAIRVARVLRRLGPVVSWRDLGIYRMLVNLREDDLAEALHPGLLRLLHDDQDGHLVRTLETFLDYGGDVKRTAARLVIHRTTLYNRLSRIQLLTSVDLDDGDDRLALHLGLKLAHLVGEHPATQTARFGVPHGHAPSPTSSATDRYQPPGQKPTGAATTRRLPPRQSASRATSS